MNDEVFNFIQQIDTMFRRNMKGLLSTYDIISGLSWMPTSKILLISMPLTMRMN